MDTSRFTDNRQEIQILDFVAMFASKTDASISFLLGRYGDTLKFADRDKPWRVGPNAVFNVFGWADIHHPCHDHVKARIRVKLSSDLMVFETQREIVQSFFIALAIRHDETYEADFFATENEASILQPVDRNGMTDDVID